MSVTIEPTTSTLDPRLAGVPHQLFIGGRFRPAHEGAEFDVFDPATDAPVARIAWGSVADARQAASAAAAALATWRAVPGPERGARLRRLYDLVVEKREWLAQIITAEQGKPLAEARGEVDYAAGFLVWASEEARRIMGDLIESSDPAKRLVVLRQGVGVTAAITPWNFPIAMLTRKLGPALAAGCTQVVKPASQTPLTALALCSLVAECDFPPGTVNLVTGPAGPIAEAWLDDPVVRKLSFTGSTEVGQRLIELSARNVTRLSLELGGHAPVIVFEDADVAFAAAESVRGKYRNTGQSCIAPNRFYVHRSLHDEFVERFAEGSRSLAVGPGTQDGVAIGPVIDDRAVDKVRKHVDDAVGRGARLVTGGDLVDLGPGHTDRFVRPTVLSGVDHSMLVARDETFGPVAPIIPFDDEAEVVAAANDSPYGLAAYFFTNDIGRAFRVGEALDYGVMGVNDCVPSTPQAPFGGLKHSGYGREGGGYVMHEYLESKFLSMRIDRPAGP